MDAYFRLTASEAVSPRIREGSLSVEDYAESLLSRIAARDGDVQAWAYLDPSHVLAEAARLDRIPVGDRGSLHGMAVAVKGIFYTKGRLAKARHVRRGPGRLFRLLDTFGQVRPRH